MNISYKVAAGIVTFNPNLAELKNNINSILQQVEHIYIYDNASRNIEEIKQFSSGLITVFQSNTNDGIAKALNWIFNECDKKGIQWVLTLDQDSICSKEHVQRLLEWLGRLDSIGIIAPTIFDRDVGIIGHNPKRDYCQVYTCITSGALTFVEAWKLVNGYDEKMFIDGVDFDFCHRIRKKGYKVIQVKDVVLDHKIGNSEKKRILFFHVVVKGHNAGRKYYMARNRIYLPKKHKFWARLIRGNLRNFKQLVEIILFEGDKKEKAKATLRGWKDGYKL